ncbi:hypothetical protein N6741_28255, partial [Klebsiella pneumoniae]|uniref:hypothetical protein n=1 Tax=Klebsiella pneumoniae TaxID=573 RepID=UPI0021BE668F
MLKSYVPNNVYVINNQLFLVCPCTFKKLFSSASASGIYSKKKGRGFIRPYNILGFIFYEMLFGLHKYLSVPRNLHP